MKSISSVFVVLFCIISLNIQAQDYITISPTNSLSWSWNSTEVQTIYVNASGDWYCDDPGPYFYSDELEFPGSDFVHINATSENLSSQPRYITLWFRCGTAIARLDLYQAGQGESVSDSTPPLWYEQFYNKLDFKHILVLDE